MGSHIDILLILEHLGRISQPLRIVTLHENCFLPTQDNGICCRTRSDLCHTHRQAVLSGCIRIRSARTDHRHLVVAVYDIVITETKRVVGSLGVHLKPLRRVTSRQVICLAALDIITATRDRLDVRIGILIIAEEHIVIIETDFQFAFLDNQSVQHTVDRVRLRLAASRPHKVLRTHIIPVGHQTRGVILIVRTEDFQDLQDLRTRHTVGCLERIIGGGHIGQFTCNCFLVSSCYSV